MRKLIILCFLLIFSGCTVDYNITIRDTGTVIEKMNTDVEKVNKNTKFETVKNDIENQYDRILKKYKYKYEILDNGDKVRFKLVNLNNVNDFFDNSLYKTLYEDCESFDSNNVHYFRTIGANYISNLFVTKNYEEKLSFVKDVDVLRINIKFENKVLKHNADKYDKNTNTYTWIFTKDDYNKSIEFSYDKAITVLKIKDKSDKKENSNFKKIKKLVILSIGLAFIGLFIILLIVTESKKVNKL